MGSSVLKTTLRGRLFLWTIMGFVPAAILAAWLIFESQQAERRVVEDQLRESAARLSQVIDRHIGRSEALLRALATSPHLDSANYAAFYAQAESLVPESARWIVLNTPDGQQIVNTYVPWGAPLARVEPVEKWAPQLLSGAAHVSNLIPSSIQERPVVCVVVPVMRDGKLRYGLTLVTLPETLNTVLSEFQFSKDWIATIVDRDATVIARSRRPEEFLGKKATGTILSFLERGRGGVVESVNLENQKMVTAIAPRLPFGWSVVVAAPRSILSAEVERLSTGALLIVAVLVLGSFLISRLTAQRIANAVDSLVESAKDLGKGQLPHTRSTGLAEMDRVSDVLVRSAEELQAREKELKRLNETLETRVQQRTEELASANRALSSRNSELEDFAHIISHDLQSPVQRMRSFADLLKTELGPQLGENGKFYVERVSASAERMSRLIRDILAFSSITTESRTIAAVDLNAIVAQVLADLESRIARTGAQIEVGQLHAVQGEKAQVFHLVTNLLSNALKFVRPGVTPLIKVESHGDGNFVQLVVSDNGIGFNESQAQKIFAPFYRLHTADEFEGTGIGLAIVRRIAERHGGSVVARSVPGQGSRFEVRLPRAIPGWA